MTSFSTEFTDLVTLLIHLFHVKPLEASKKTMRRLGTRKRKEEINGVWESKRKRQDKSDPDRKQKKNTGVVKVHRNLKNEMSSDDLDT